MSASRQMVLPRWGVWVLALRKTSDDPVVVLHEVHPGDLKSQQFC